MKVLIVEDDELSQQVFDLTFQQMGFSTILARDGEEGWSLFLKDLPHIVFSDWVMPNLDGLELCRRIRQSEHNTSRYTYFILGTAHYHGVDDYIQAVKVGVDNILYKPWHHYELVMTIQIAKRTLQYIEEIGKLRKLLPICKYCKKVATHPEFWERIEKYIQEEVGSDFSHGICPECAKKLYEEFQASSKQQKKL